LIDGDLYELFGIFIYVRLWAVRVTTGGVKGRLKWTERHSAWKDKESGNDSLGGYCTDMDICILRLNKI